MCCRNTAITQTIIAESNGAVSNLGGILLWSGKKITAVLLVYSHLIRLLYMGCSTSSLPNMSELPGFIYSIQYLEPIVEIIGIRDSGK